MIGDAENVRQRSRLAASLPLIHHGDQFDLDHRLGLGEAANLDRRAGWSGDAEIAHAYVAAL